jgi:hypothetical protein
MSAYRSMTKHALQECMSFSLATMKAQTFLAGCFGMPHILCELPCVPNIFFPECIVHRVASSLNCLIRSSRAIVALEALLDIRKYSLQLFVMAHQQRGNHTVKMFILLPIYSRLFLSSLRGAIRYSYIVVSLASVSSLVFPAIHLQVSRLTIFRGFISCVIIRKIVEWLLDMDQQGD